jgi:2-polyprenyl-6-methoxyphenol hydroxylase-like FAD-dependent oxidoreductase
MGRTLLVGGGIGGLAAAIALRSTPTEPLVLERAQDLAKLEVGAGITLWPNALRVLDRLGLADEVCRRGHVIDTMEQRTLDDRPLVRWNLRDMARRVGAPMIGVGRPELHAALATAAGSLVKTNAQCTRVVQDDADVTAELAGGRAERGDILVGADGIESVVRAGLLGAEEPRHAGLAMWRASVQFAPEEMPTIPFVVYWGPAARFVVFRSGEGLLSWEAIVRVDPDGERPAAGGKEAVLERFAGYPDAVARVVQATDAAAINAAEVVDRPPSERWGQGRITLLGDAAHPMTFAVGQGAAQALEDGLALAAAVAAHGESPTALRAYEERRMKRSAHFQTMAWRLARIGRWDGSLPCAARNFVLRLTGRFAGRMQERDVSIAL